MAPRRPRSPDSAVLGHWPAAVPRPTGPPSPPAPSASRTSTHSATPQPRRRIQSSRPIPARRSVRRQHRWVSSSARACNALATSAMAFRPGASASGNSQTRRPASGIQFAWLALLDPPGQVTATKSENRLWPPRRFFRPRPPAPAHRAEPPVPPGYTGGAGAARLCSSSPPSASRVSGKKSFLPAPLSTRST